MSEEIKAWRASLDRYYKAYEVGMDHELGFHYSRTFADHLDGACNLVEHLEDRIDELEAKLKLMVKYAEHILGCYRRIFILDNHVICSCGLDKLLEEVGDRDGR